MLGRQFYTIHEIWWGHCHYRWCERRWGYKNTI